MHANIRARARTRARTHARPHIDELGVGGAGLLLGPQQVPRAAARVSVIDYLILIN